MGMENTYGTANELIN